MARETIQVGIVGVHVVSSQRGAGDRDQGQNATESTHGSRPFAQPLRGANHTSAASSLPDPCRFVPSGASGPSGRAIRSRGEGPLTCAVMTRVFFPRATHRGHLFASAAAVFASAAAALAQPSVAVANTKTFRQATAKDFDEGEVTGASILPTGDVVPGLIATRVALDAAFVWCSAAGRDGATVYFGTGDEGRIFAVPAHGDAKTAQRIATLDAPWVTALAMRADGKLLAATTPSGRIFIVDPKTGGFRVLASVGTGHVWTLARDDKAAVTYVGTGAPGKIFALDDGGKSRQVWDSRDKHVVSLMRDTDGTLLAGTSEAAILYRVHPDGHAEVIEDFDAEEVRAIVRAPSGLFVAVNDFEKAAALVSVPGAAVPAKGTKIIVAAGGPPASAGALPRPGVRKAKAAVYRIETNGRIEQVFSLADGYLTALAVADDGSVYAAAGTQGHVFRIAADGTSSLVIDLPERQVLTLLRIGGAVLAGTGDVGGVYRAVPPVGSVEGRYLSKVLDAEFPAHWGALRWMGSQVTFETRSGNTAKPDEDWTPWQTLEKAEAGKIPAEPSAGGGHVASPSARYLQYRASLRGPTSRLRGVTTSYLPQNQRARVTELTLADGAATVPAIGASTVSVSARSGHSATLKLRWKTDNPDGDEVIYRLAFRQVGESVWRPLISASVDWLTKPEYDWNTEGIPDGVYVVRVIASDERSQPRDRALVSAFESSPLLVDNGRPVVEELTARYPMVTGRAKDDASAITQIEFAVDGGEFQLVSPTDGIADDLTEPFAIRLPALVRGPHAIAVRITDSADNIGSGRVTLRAP